MIWVEVPPGREAVGTSRSKINILHLRGSIGCAALLMLVIKEGPDKEERKLQ